MRSKRTEKIVAKMVVGKERLEKEKKSKERENLPREIRWEIRTPSRRAEDLRWRDQGVPASPYRRAPASSLTMRKNLDR